MNWDQIQGKWKQSAGKIKEKWGKLTDDDLTTINGKREQLVGKFRSATESPKTLPKSRWTNLQVLIAWTTHPKAPRAHTNRQPQLSLKNQAQGEA